jgi:hypothetical protein
MELFCKPQPWTKEVKDTNPLMSSSLVILFGAVKQFSRFRSWSETECKTPADYSPQYISNPPPHSHTLSVFTVHWEGGEGGGGQREGTVEGQPNRMDRIEGT